MHRFFSAAFAAAILSATALPAAAQSVNDYRQDFIEMCDDASCACIFDEWVNRIDSETAPGAIAAAKMMVAGGDYEPSQTEAMSAMPYMSPLSDATMACLNMPQTPTTPAAPAMTEKPAETAPAESPVASLGIDYDAKYEAALADIDSRGITETSVAGYKNVHMAKCMRDFEDKSYCACSWSTLETTVGSDSNPARITAYMSSVPPSDMQGVSQEDKTTAFALFGQYMTNRDASCPMP